MNLFYILISIRKAIYTMGWVYMNILTRMHLCLIGCAILFVPFIGSVEIISVLGGLGKNGSIYPLLLGIILFILEMVMHKRKLYIPEGKSFYALLFFCFIGGLSGIANFAELSNLWYQGANGGFRFFLQIGSVIFCLCTALYIYNIFRISGGEQLEVIERFVMLSFVMAGGYSLLELGQLLGVVSATHALYFFNGFFRGENADLLYLRIRSLAIEAPTFAMYVSILFPWILSLWWKWKGIKKAFAILIFFYFILLALLSFSRTAYFILSIEAVLYFILFQYDILMRWKSVVFTLILFLLIAYGAIYQLGNVVPIDVEQVFTSLFTSDQTNQFDSSTNVRYATTVAGLLIWQDHPILGVGLGGYGFYCFDYLPSWIWQSPDPYLWRDNTLVRGVWPPIHNLFARLLAETGILGVMAWLSAFVFLFWEEILVLRTQIGQMESVLLKNLMVSTVGAFLCGFSGDSIYFSFYWIIFGTVWFYLDRFKRGIYS